MVRFIFPENSDANAVWLADYLALMVPNYYKNGVHSLEIT